MRARMRRWWLSIQRRWRETRSAATCSGARRGSTTTASPRSVIVRRERRARVDRLTWNSGKGTERAASTAPMLDVQRPIVGPTRNPSFLPNCNPRGLRREFRSLDGSNHPVRRVSCAATLRFRPSLAPYTPRAGQLSRNATRIGIWQKRHCGEPPIGSRQPLPHPSATCRQGRPPDLELQQGHRARCSPPRCYRD